MAHKVDFQYIDVNTLIGINGKPELLYDIDTIKMSIYNIITTPAGSRRFLPLYGSRAYSFLQEPTDDRTAFQLKLSLVQSLRTFEPRITVDVLTTEITLLDPPTGFKVNVKYSINETGKQDSFVIELEK